MKKIILSLIFVLSFSVAYAADCIGNEVPSCSGVTDPTLCGQSYQSIGGYNYNYCNWNPGFPPIIPPNCGVLPLGTCTISTPCLDNDLDGWGDPANPSCTHSGFDCNDGDPSINPGETEICNTINDDCDAGTPDGSDELWYGQPTSCGTLGVCISTGIYDCVGGVQVNTCIPGTASDEICDGLDNDCDGSIDEGFTEDIDNDGILDCIDTSYDGPPIIPPGTTCSQMWFIVKSYCTGGVVDLQTDIDCGEVEGLTPICDYTSPQINGNGHKITNIDMDCTGINLCGLFRNVNAPIYNLGIENSNFYNAGSVGVFGGYLEGAGRLYNSYSNRNTIIGHVNVGGLIGDQIGGTISQCYSTNNNIQGWRSIGGITGYQENAGSILDSYANNNHIISSTGYAIGGLMGESDYNARVTNSYASCNEILGTIPEYTNSLVGKSEVYSFTDTYSDINNPNTCDGGICPNQEDFDIYGNSEPWSTTIWGGVIPNSYPYLLNTGGDQIYICGELPVCGNAACETGETFENCPVDCGQGNGGDAEIPEFSTLGIIIVSLAAIGMMVVFRKKK